MGLRPAYHAARNDVPLRSCFFFNDTATTEIYTLSLHDALPIYAGPLIEFVKPAIVGANPLDSGAIWQRIWKMNRSVSTNAIGRSEEHTSELQSRLHLVCRLLLEKKIGHGITSCLPRGPERRPTSFLFFF